MVARQLGKVCLVGCDALEIDLPARRIRIGAREFAEFEVLSLDGNRGAVHAGTVRTVRREPADLLRRLAALRSVS